MHIISDPFAWGWNVFGTAHIPWTPILTGAMGYMQGAVLIFIYLFSLDYGYKLSKRVYADEGQAKRGFIPIALFLSLVTFTFLWLFMG